MSTTPKQHNPDNMTPDEYGANGGWRLLYSEELAKLPFDSEYWSELHGEWLMSSFRNTNPGASSICPKTGFTYRTRTPDPYAPKAAADKSPDSGWIKMSDRRPTFGMQPLYWAFRDGRVLRTEVDGEMYTYSADYWKEAEPIPAPPSRELTQPEKDEAAASSLLESEWAKNLFARSAAPMRELFMAGIAYERAEIEKICCSKIGQDSALLNDVYNRAKGTQ